MHVLFVLRAASLIALSASLALLADYLAPQMAFCSAASGCGKVKDSGLGYVLIGDHPIPYLPWLGVLSFAGIFSASLSPRAEVRRAVIGVLGPGVGLGGLLLLVLQAVAIGEYCWLCVIVDLCALTIAAATLALRGEGFRESLASEHLDTIVEAVDLPLSESHRSGRVWQEDSVAVSAPNSPVKPRPRGELRISFMGWISLGVLSAAAPLLYPAVVAPSPLPQSVAELYTPGRVNVVEFFDYQCPHCRLALPALEQALAEFSGPTAVTQAPIGLPAHALGKRAARIHLCAAEQGKVELVQPILLQGPELQESAVDAAEGAAGLDTAALQACLKSARPDDAMKLTVDRLKAADFVGLPTTYIGERRLLGALSPEAYLEALEDAARSGGRLTIGPAVYSIGVLLLALGIALSARHRPRSALAGVPRRPSLD